MARFTDSPYEYMMAQKPSARQERDIGPPPDQPTSAGAALTGSAAPVSGSA